MDRFQYARVAIGVIMIIVMAAEFYLAESDANDASDAGASAIQIVQVWTPHLFYMMAIIGFGIAAYIITRVVE